MYHGITGSSSDKYRADVAAKTLNLFEEVGAATWKDKFWADATAVLAEDTDEGVQQKLFDLAMSITAWDKALTQRRAQGNEDTT